MNQSLDTSYITHITSRSLWDMSQKTGWYLGDTLDTQGFIHCSMIDQVIDVANAVYHGQTDMLLLLIDTSKVTSPLRYEAVETDFYPHIYGPLNVNAVQAIYLFPPDEYGQFHLPGQLNTENTSQAP